MEKIKIAFFGAPQFAASVLQRVMDDADLPVEVQCVVTQPDRPAGRKQIMTPTPVKVLAESYNIHIYTELNSPKLQQTLKECNLVLLYAFGAILPPIILKLPRWGFWNIHPSLLPKYRNTSPIAYSLLLGDTVTGVSLIEIDEKLDHGPLIDQESYQIQDTDTRTILENRLSEIGYKLFKKNVQLLIDGLLKKEEQNHQLRTYSRLLTKKDGFIPSAIFRKIIDGEELVKDEVPPIITQYLNKYNLPIEPYINLRSYYLLFRALSPWPGLWTVVTVNGVEKRLKIIDMELKDVKPVITKVQLEGKSIVSFKQLNDYLHIV
jgi:methionyl-tRNA formyltransferase